MNFHQIKNKWWGIKIIRSIFQSVLKSSSLGVQAPPNHTPKSGLSKTESVFVITLTNFVIEKFSIFNLKKFKVQVTPKSDQIMSYRAYRPCNNLNVIR